MSPQQKRVLGFLKRRPQGICIDDVPHDIGYTLRNRVAELRKPGNITIESERCTFHNHGAPVVRYRLARPFVQQELGL